MMFFIRLGRVRALNIEFNRDFGFFPPYKKTSYRCETILDMPYTQVIFTSGQWTPLRRASNDTKETEQTARHLERTDQC
jgi:hypothetical protein